MERSSTMVASRCANVVAGAGSVKSSAGTYTAWKRRDGTFLGRGDAFLQVAHFGGERRLVTDGARRAAQQRGHFGTGLREAENVVHEQQHVLVLLVAEIFGHGERGQRHAETRAGRFVHLAVNQADLGTGLR